MTAHLKRYTILYLINITDVFNSMNSNEWKRPIWVSFACTTFCMFTERRAVLIKACWKNVFQESSIVITKSIYVDGFRTTNTISYLEVVKALSSFSLGKTRSSGELFSITLRILCKQSVAALLAWSLDATAAPLSPAATAAAVVDATISRVHNLNGPMRGGDSPPLALAICLDVSICSSNSTAVINWPLITVVVHDVTWPPLFYYM